jgi:CheY-like chemotaxis protein
MALVKLQSMQIEAGLGFLFILLEHLYLNLVIFATVDISLNIDDFIALSFEFLDNLLIFAADGFYLGHDALAAGVLPEDLELISQLADVDLHLFDLMLEQVDLLDAAPQLVDQLVLLRVYLIQTHCLQLATQLLRLIMHLFVDLRVFWQILHTNLLGLSVLSYIFRGFPQLIDEGSLLNDHGALFAFSPKLASADFFQKDVFLMQGTLFLLYLFDSLSELHQFNLEDLILADEAIFFILHEGGGLHADAEADRAEFVDFLGLLVAGVEALGLHHQLVDLLLHGLDHCVLFCQNGQQLLVLLRDLQALLLDLDRVLMALGLVEGLL